MYCPICNCSAAQGLLAHKLQELLFNDHLDAAIDHGLLDEQIMCVQCGVGCQQALQAARIKRQRALEARQRFHAHQSRIAKQKAKHQRNKISATAIDKKKQGYKSQVTTRCRGAAQSCQKKNLNKKSL